MPRDFMNAYKNAKAKWENYPAREILYLEKKEQEEEKKQHNNGKENI